MEVKINREIRNYTESMFFGLSLRQFVFSLLAVGVAVLLYFVLKPYVGTETVSWMCILGAAPFAAMGFVNYNGMTAEQFVWAWLRSEMLEPKHIKFEPVNIYYEALKDAIDEREKEVSKHNDYGRRCFTESMEWMTKSLPWRCRRWAMWVANPIGHGTASAAVWSGAPVSSAGAQTNAAISTPVSFRSSQVVSTVSNGSGSVGSGRITPCSPRPA